MKIIDAHMHICKSINGVGSRGELIPLGNGMVTYTDNVPFRIIPEGLGDTSFTYETLLEVMEKYNVEKGVLLQGNYLGFQNLYTYEAYQKHPNRFVPAATYDPFSSNRKKIIEHLFDDLKIKVIKLECSNGSGFMAIHNTFPLNGKEMTEIYDMARAHNLIVVMDIGRPNNNCYQIDNLLDVVTKYSDITFVICHLLAHQKDDFTLLKYNMEKFKKDNVYFDLASVNNNTKPEVFPYPTASKFIRYACDIVGSDHLMWGSDIPAGITKDSYEHAISYIMDNDLFTLEEKENIFYNTANKVYFGKI